MDLTNDIPDLLGQLQLALNARQQDMSLSSLRISLTRVYVLRATLCAQINSRSLINELPNELIMEIFKHALQEKEPCPTIALDVRETARVHTRPLLRLTHVCRQWRSLALAHPNLWQRIDCHHPEQLEEFALRRSCPGPFSLFVNMSKYAELGDQSALRFVLFYSDRLRRLDIAFLRRHDAYLHDQLLHLSCPNLECLTVTNYPPPARLDGRGISPFVVVRKSLFQEGLLRLRALAIFPIPDWLPTNPLPALTHLFLYFRWKCDLRTAHVLSLLAGSPSLEMVHLSQFDLPSDERPNERTHVHLPLLKHILFSNRSFLSSSLALLRQLIIPASARTYLGCHNVRSTTASSILPILPSTAGADHLAIVNNDDSLQLIACTRSHVGSSQYECAFWLSAEETIIYEDNFATWLTHLPEMFPLTTLTSLQLRLTQPGSTVSRILRACPSLATLEIMFTLSYELEEMENALVYVCHTLSLNKANIYTSWDLDPYPPAEPQLCPVLRSLTISLECEVRPIADYIRWLSVISTMVHARARMGRPLRCLRVQPMHCAERNGAAGDIIDAVQEAYTSLAEADGVEEFVLHRSSEEPIDFSMQGQGQGAWDWGEVERYWTIAEDDRPRFYYPWRA
ncbi:hypothetical protein OH76DRAFT_1039592 [Lentinus brumalis]|uniref:F-box domain-containing protein n=1 Tax=Lentinus brumalis TaxID=2498619 RepID=A0A371CWY5_9APHY|nr:hypothetical protein OH76DRAFT_1039592 [Polyporus brumalis]